MKSLCHLFMFFLSLTMSHAQGWERFYPELTSLDLTYGVVPTPDGGVLMTADDQYWSVDPHLFLKIAPGGAPQWLQPQSNFITGRWPAMLPLENGHLLFAAFNSATGQTDLTETNGDLQVVWANNVNGVYIGNYQPPHLVAAPGAYFIAYQTGIEYAPVKVSKTDLLGETIWQKTYDFDALGAPMRNFYSIAADAQGNFYLSGVQDFPYVPVLAKFSPAGDLIYVQTYPQPNLIYGFGSLAVLNDNLIAAVSSSNTAIINAENGVVLNTIPAPEATVVRTTQDDKLLVYSRETGNLLLRKLEWNGTLLWQHTFDRPENFELASHLWSLPDGGVMGLARAFTGVGYTPFVFRTDANGATFTSRLYGNVGLDLDADCLGDSAANNRIVVAAKPGDTRYATTDPQGNYDFLLDTGTYLVNVLPPNDLWSLCEDSVTVTLNLDTLQWNTAITTYIDCPWPTVDLSALFLRRCFPSTYTISYGNEGTASADSAVVTLILDSFLIIQSASLPYSSLGENIYQFPVGDLAPLQSGVFSVTVLVDCNAELGQTHCSSVQVDIANPCPTTGIETPVIDVTAACEGDSVAFTIKNIGGAPMTNPAEFVVIEDLIVMREGEFQLPEQAETTVKWPADGSTVRMYAGQAPGEPPFFAVTTAIEGCNGPVQPGFWNMYPEMFTRQGADRDCQPNIGAYDPNDKQAVPTGYADEHWIARGVPLDYRIRFQNTGTDTAFTVVVRDTLSTFLNAASLRPGSASHPYTWQLLGNGVLEFRFENILLPDSSTNLDASQGFVQFFIEQQPDLPLLTLIENDAAIFFDFNAPVITNTTFHRIGEDFLPSVSSWEPVRPAVLVRVMPNPAASVARLELQGWNAGTPLRLQLFDLQGNVVREMTSDGSVFELQRSQLAAGLYLFQITQNGTLVGRGKLVLH